MVDDHPLSIQHLDISITDNAAAANVVVTLVHDRDLPRALEQDSTGLTARSP